MQWFTVPTTINRPKYLAHVSVHNAVVYINVSERSKKFLVKYPVESLLVKCPVESLLAACMQSHDLRLDMQVKQISLSTGRNGYNTVRQIVTCGQQLYALHHELMDVDSTPTPQQYVYASDLPECMQTGFLTTLHTNELLVATLACRQSQWTVSKGSIRSEEGGGRKVRLNLCTCTREAQIFTAFISLPAGCQYNVDDQFNISALHKLEAAGIPVLSSLAPLYKELASALEIPQAEIEKQKLPSRVFNNTTQQKLDIVMELWLSGKGPLLPIWRTLYQMLRLLGLKVLSKQIAEYLGGM